MEKDITISARVSTDLAEKINLLSKEYRRSRSWLMEDALRQYVASELEFLEAVQEGLDDIAAGRVVSHEEVVAGLEARKRKWQN